MATILMMSPKWVTLGLLKIVITSQLLSMTTPTKFSLALKLETTHKPATNQSQTSQITDKPPKNQPVISRKSAFHVTKNFRNNGKHVLNL